MVNVDMLLTIVGIVLIVIGVGVLLLGKSRVNSDGERSNVFEAFGIKLDVANPSVLLIMFGVVLMLAPRFVPLGETPVANLLPEPAPAYSEPVEQPHDAVAQAQAQARLPDPVVTPPPGPSDQETAAAAAAQADEAAALADAQRQQAEAAARQRAAEQAALDKQRRALAQVKARLAAERARLAALDASPDVDDIVLPTEPTASGTPPAEPALPRLMILTQSIAYEGETDTSLRDKVHDELRVVVGDLLADSVQLDRGNPDFASEPRRHELLALCKRTQADNLLVADLTAVEVESLGIESANWPDMRFAAVHCASGRVNRTSAIRLVPKVGDRFPMQQAVARSAREFVSANRYLLR